MISRYTEENLQSFVLSPTAMGVLMLRDGNSSLRLGLESHLSCINKDLGLDLDS